MIWRRVPPWNVVYDPKAGGCRPSTAAFEDDYDADPMSACLGDKQTTVADLLAGHSEFAVAAFRLQAARAKELGVAHDPLPGEPDHVVIIGNKTRSARKALVEASTWVVPPPLSACKAPESKCTCFPRGA